MEIVILPSGSPIADAEKTAWSFAGIFPVAVRHKPDLASVIHAPIREDWFFVIYDDEQVEEALFRALSVYMQAESIDLFICMKRIIDKELKTLRVFQAPRLFRRHIRPQADSLVPQDMDRICWSRALDGWIDEHEFA